MVRDRIGLSVATPLEMCPRSVVGSAAGHTNSGGAQLSFSSDANTFGTVDKISAKLPHVGYTDATSFGIQFARTMPFHR